MNEDSGRASGLARLGRGGAFRARLWRGLLAVAMGAGLVVAGLGAPRAAEAAPPPTSCAAVRAANPAAGDGEYTILAGAQPLTLYCHDMAGTPHEYLSLVNTGGNFNFGQYTAGGASSGVNTRTNYTRLRIDPVTLQAHIADQTFSTSTGLVFHGGMSVTSMPLGVAMSCNGSVSGVANIDLTGTGLQVNDNFFVSGSAAGGLPTGAVTGQVVQLSGGGFCGWNAPEVLFNPFNQDVTVNGGFVLQLAFAADTTPPVVTLELPVPNAQGWYTTPVVTGTVNATDRSDVTAIVCTGDGVTLGPLQPGTATTASRSITVTGEGVHSITCTATDGATPSNTGAAALSTNTATVPIDSVAPELSYHFHPATRGVEASGRDATSGLTIGGVVSPVTCTSQRTGQVCVYRVSDLAGNSITLTLQLTKSSNQTRVRATSIQYSGRPAMAPLANELVFEYTPATGPLTQLKQCGKLTHPAGATPAWSQELCATLSGGNTTFQFIKPAYVSETKSGVWVLGVTTGRGGFQPYFYNTSAP